MAGETTREVVFLLKTAMDSTIASGFSDIARRARTAQQEIDRGVKQSAELQSKAAKERTREFEREQAAMNRARKEQLASEERDRKEALSALAAATRERARIDREANKQAELAARELAKQQTALAKQRTREAAQAAKQATKAEQEAAREAAQAAKQATKAKQEAAREAAQAAKERFEAMERLDARQFAAAMKRIKDRDAAEKKAAKEQVQAGERAVGFERRAYTQEQKAERGLQSAAGHFAGAGKSALMLMGTSEEDMEKMIRNLLKIQLIYSTILSAKEGVESLQRSWRAYAYSVELAAKAHAAFAVAQGTAVPSGINGAVGAAMARSSSLIGSILTAGRGALAGLGGLVGGGAVAGAGIVGGIGAGATLAYKLGTIGPQNEAAKAAYHTDVMQSNIASRRAAEQEATAQQERIAQIRREQEEAIYASRHHGFELGVSGRYLRQELLGPNIGKMMSEWSPSMAGGGRREPGAAGYKKVEEALAAGRTTSSDIVSKYEANAAAAEKDVATKRAAQRAAEEEAGRFKDASMKAQGDVVSAAMRAEENKSQWIPGLNWLHRTGSWVGSWWKGSQKTAQTELEEKAANARLSAKGMAETAGGKETDARAAAQATEDALKRQRELVEKTAAVQQEQNKRNIQNAEEFIGKLKEMKKAHLQNAEALEKQGRALAIQLAIGSSSDRRKLMHAMEREKLGMAEDKDLALLASKASPERAEVLEKQLESRHPEYSALRDYLGVGKTAVDREKAKAADEGARIKQQEAYISKAKEATIAAADSMAERVAKVMSDLMAVMDARFTEALNRAMADFSTRQKALSE